METIAVNTSQHINIDYPVAGLGERIAARLIDTAAFIGLFILVVLTSVFTSSVIEQSPTVFIIFYLTILGVYAFYDLLCEIFLNGQSLGKKVMKIRVISSDGNQAGIGQYVIRWLFRTVDFTLTMQIGGLICVAVSEKKQRIGDIVAGTVVIRTTPPVTFGQVAFHPSAQEEYVPVFSSVHQLTDRDIELVHEVLTTYYKTYNYELVQVMAEKVTTLLSDRVPEGMTELQFLQTIVKDYNYLTAAGV